MNEIMLITTKGCEGCEIMETSIHKAVGSTRKDIDFTVKDYKDVDKHFLKKYNIKDFPTTLFFRDGGLVRKEVATRPAIVVLRWIDIDFK